MIGKKCFVNGNGFNIGIVLSLIVSLLIGDMNVTYVD